MGRSADRHKVPTITLRLPEGERQRLRAYAAATGQRVHGVLVEAVRAYLDQVAPRERNGRDHA